MQVADSMHNTSASKPQTPEEVVRMDAVSKSFVGTEVLHAANFNLLRGECHILFGENGAGKSTLIQILAGVHQPTKGTIYFDGVPVEIVSVHHSRSLGISAVFQEFSIAPNLTVAENLFLGSEPKVGFFLNRKLVRREARKILDNFGFDLRLDTIAGDLSRAEMQMLEIARAFRTPPSVLILDEPTASLTEAESERLFALIAQLKEQGVGIIYITHRMREIARIGDRVTVLRDGYVVDTLGIEDASVERLISLMTGRDKTELFPSISYNPGEVLFDVSDLTTTNTHIKNATFKLRAGEIVGLAGLVGSGKGEIGLACIGAVALKTGEILLDGKDMVGTTPRKALDNGLCYLPSDRRTDGLFMEHSIRENISIAYLELPPILKRRLIRRKHENKLAHEMVKQIEIKPASIDAEVMRLSGGNQQKVMIGRFIARSAKVYIFDEPTVGVDVGARHAIYEQIKYLCEGGAAVLLISSDLSEIVNLTHRSYVMHNGEIVAECEKHEYSEENLLHFMFGEKSEQYTLHSTSDSIAGEPNEH